jgi:hypothetical protein
MDFNSQFTEGKPQTDALSSCFARDSGCEEFIKYGFLVFLWNAGSLISDTSKNIWLPGPYFFSKHGRNGCKVGQAAKPVNHTGGNLDS